METEAGRGAVVLGLATRYGTETPLARMEVSIGRPSKYYKAYFALLVLLAGTVILGCGTRVLPAREESLREGIPTDSGLAFGRIQWELKHVDVYLLNLTTKQELTFTTEKSGDFFLLLPAGDYVITRITSGLFHIYPREEGVGRGFTILSGSAVYLGTLQIKGPPRTFGGEMVLLDEFEAASQRLKARYPALPLEQPPLRSLMRTRRLTVR